MQCSWGDVYMNLSTQPALKKSKMLLNMIKCNVHEGVFTKTCPSSPSPENEFKKLWIWQNLILTRSCLHELVYPTPPTPWNAMFKRTRTCLSSPLSLKKNSRSFGYDKMQCSWGGVYMNLVEPSLVEFSLVELSLVEIGSPPLPRLNKFSKA